MHARTMNLSSPGCMASVRLLHVSGTPMSRSITSLLNSV